jgi:hypothetical protein
MSCVQGCSGKLDSSCCFCGAFSLWTPVGGTILGQDRTELVMLEVLVATVVPCLGFVAVTLKYVVASYRRGEKFRKC